MTSDVKLSRTWVTVGPCQSYLENIVQLVKSKISSYVCFADVPTLTAACEQTASRQVIDSADLITILMDDQYGAKSKNAYEANVSAHILKEAENHRFSIFLYGPGQEIIDLVIAKVQKDFPLLEIAGHVAASARPLTEEEDMELTKAINHSGAHIVLISLGSFEQERWMYKHKGEVKACMLGLGQAFHAYVSPKRKSARWSLKLPFRLVAGGRNFSASN